MSYISLSPEYVISHIDALLDIASDVADEYWTKEHFLADLPMKWDLSFAAEHKGQPIAYAVLSKKAENQCHLHHFMVHRDWRGKGLGKEMLKELEERARAADFTWLSLKIASGNTRAREFYIQQGFENASESEPYRVYVKPL